MSTSLREGTPHPGPRRRRSPRADRRIRRRLRELCEEVLASYRIAQGADLLSTEDRDAANQLLSSLTPKLAR